MLPPLPAERRLSPCPASTYLARFATSKASQCALGASVRLVADMICPSPLRGLRDKVTGKPLVVVLDRIPWPALERAHVTAIRGALVARYAPASTNRHLAGLRGVLTECWRSGLLSQEKLAHLLDAARDVPGAGQRTKAEAPLTPEEISALFKACAQDRTVAGPRDAALLALLFGVGLRRSSAVALQLADYDRSTGRLVVQAKGGKVAALYLPQGARSTLEDWLTVRGSEPGPLLTATSKARKRFRKDPGHPGHVIMRGLSADHVYRICDERAQDARLERKFRPHDARRAVAGHAIDAADLATAQAMLMHASPTVTARYDLRGERRLRQVAERLHVPHFPRSREESAPCAR